MFTLSRTWILTLVLCPLGVVRADPGRFTATQAGQTSERLRERWEGRSPEERERLERNLEEFEKLPVDVRRRVLERARTLRERERSLEREMPRELRERMRELGPERGRELWRQHLR